MTGSVRRVAAVVLALFGALFLNLNVVGVLRADEYREHPRNTTRQLEQEYGTRRGSILLADGATEVASVEETGGNLRFRRTYPEGELYAHLTGYYSFVYGRSGLEQSHNDALTGSADVIGSFTDLVAGRERIGDNVVSTVVPQVQQAARDALGGRRGAVVALDPSTGHVLAAWSAPSYDPAPLSSFDGQEVRATWDRLNADPAMPLNDRALRGFYAPGSTFKVVTTAAALENGISPEQTFEDPARQDLPLTEATIGNFGGGTCNGGSPITLAEALEVSCNTTFAQVALQLGAEVLVRTAESFGFNGDLGGEISTYRPGFIPAASELDAPSTAQSAIGQRDVRVSPLQMAAVVGAIGEGGVLRAPRLVARVEDVGGAVLAESDPVELRRAVSEDTAAALTAMMVDVVASGTGTRAQLPDVVVAGKTGTAESGVEGGNPTVWFTGFAPAEDPTVAVAVVIEDGGDVGSEATGGAVAAPVAQAVLAAALQAR